jgi:hypothetical protein
MVVASLPDSDSSLAYVCSLVSSGLEIKIIADPINTAQQATNTYIISGTLLATSTSKYDI